MSNYRTREFDQSHPSWDAGTVTWTISQETFPEVDLAGNWPRHEIFVEDFGIHHYDVLYRPAKGSSFRSLATNVAPDEMTVIDSVMVDAIQVAIHGGGAPVGGEKVYINSTTYARD